MNKLFRSVRPKIIQFAIILITVLLSALPARAEEVSGKGVSDIRVWTPPNLTKEESAAMLEILHMYFTKINQAFQKENDVEFLKQTNALLMYTRQIPIYYLIDAHGFFVGRLHEDGLHPHASFANDYSYRLLRQSEDRYRAAYKDIKPLFGLLMVSAPTARDVALAQGDGRSGGGTTDLRSKIELFKGSEVVVLTVVDSGQSMPIAARVDSIKSNRDGPTSLLPFQSQVTGAAPRDGPTSLLPSQSPVTGAVLRRGPTRLVPYELRVTAAAVQDRPAKPIRFQSPAAGALLRDRPVGGGVLVQWVEQGSPAWQDGLRRADVIAFANRVKVSNIEELETALESAGPTVVFQVRRSGNEIIVVFHR